MKEVVVDRLSERFSPVRHLEFERIAAVNLYGSRYRVLITVALHPPGSRSDHFGRVQGYVYSQFTQSWGLLIDYPMDAIWASCGVYNEYQPEGNNTVVKELFESDYKRVYSELFKIAGQRNEVHVNAYVEEA